MRWFTYCGFLHSVDGELGVDFQRAGHVFEGQVEVFVVGEVFDGVLDAAEAHAEFLHVFGYGSGGDAGGEAGEGG